MGSLSDIIDFISKKKILNSDEKNFKNNVIKKTNSEIITNLTQIKVLIATTEVFQEMAYANPNVATELTDSQRKANAKYIYKYLSGKGWSTQAICGLLGNIEQESCLNPAAWQNNTKVIDNSDIGYGLVQFTPASKFSYKYNLFNCEKVDSMSKNPKNLIETQLDFIIKSSQPEYGEWISLNSVELYGSPYLMEFEEFYVSKNNPGDLALVFHGSYERSADNEETKKYRVQYANEWYEYFREK